MHELLLHGSIPTSRHRQVLSILAGIAAMQPQPFHERHLIYKPTRPVSRTATQVGGTQAVQSKQNTPMQAMQGAMQGDLFYLHLVEDLTGKTDGEVDGTRAERGVGDGERMAGIDEGGGSNEQPPTSTKYTLQFRDIPEAGPRRPVTSRLITDIPITAGDAAAFMSAFEYTLVPSFLPPPSPPNPLRLNNNNKKTSHTTTHHLHGHRLTYSATSILLFQAPSPSPSHQQKQQQLSILQLSIRVPDASKPLLMDRAVKELIALKEMLRGVVEVDVVERGCLDMRVR
ncbi:MAG: hypothetical protein Q9182_000339 [Xanthomendoza sp. 2 TL-2023]